MTQTYFTQEKRVFVLQAIMAAVGITLLLLVSSRFMESTYPLDASALYGPRAVPTVVQRKKTNVEVRKAIRLRKVPVQSLRSSVSSK